MKRPAPGPHLTLREFRREDWAAILAIDAACFAPDLRYTRLDMADFQSLPGAFTLVAHSSPPTAGGDAAGAETKAVPAARAPGEAPGAGPLVGFILAALELDRGHIITLDVLPAWRRGGVGRALMEAAEQRLRAGGAGQIWLEAIAANAGPLAFYHRLGYALRRRLPRYYPGGRDGVLLTKALAPAAAGARGAARPAP